MKKNQAVTTQPSASGHEMNLQRQPSAPMQSSDAAAMSPAPMAAPPPTLRDVLRPRNLDQALHLARLVSSSKNLMSASMRDDPMLVVALMEFGERFGMTLIESVQNIAVIKGKFTMYGDRLLAVVNATGLVEDMKESWDYGKDGKASAGRCWVKRKGRPTAVEREFTMAEAIQAGLPNRNETWKTYPKRMLQMRARGLVLRDLFPEVLQGMIPREEAEDMVLDARTGLEVERPEKTRVVEVAAHAPAQPPDAAPEQEKSVAETTLDRVLELIRHAGTQAQLDYVVPIARGLSGEEAGHARAAFSARKRDLKRECDDLFAAEPAMEEDEPLRKTS